MKHSRDEIYMYLFDTICLNTPTDNCICSDPHKNPRSCISFCTCLKKKRIWIWNFYNLYLLDSFLLQNISFDCLVYLCHRWQRHFNDIYRHKNLWKSKWFFYENKNILSMCSLNKIYHLNFSFKSWRQLTLVTVGAEKSRLALADVRK